MFTRTAKAGALAGLGLGAFIRFGLFLIFVASRDNDADA